MGLLQLVTNLMILISLDPDKQFTDQNLRIGTASWACLHDLDENKTSSYSAVRSVSTTKKMIGFNDVLLKDLEILQPQKTSTYLPSTIDHLANHICQLGLADSASQSASGRISRLHIITGRPHNYKEV